MSTTSKITYNRGIFRINKDSSHPMVPCSMQLLIQSFMQLVLMVLCIHDLGRQTGAEELLIRGGKKGLWSLVIIPAGSRAVQIFSYHFLSAWFFFVLVGFVCFFVVVCLGFIFPHFLSVNQTNDFVSATSLKYTVFIMPIQLFSY